MACCGLCLIITTVPQNESIECVFVSVLERVTWLVSIQRVASCMRLNSTKANPRL